jgi:hypothetical protein
VIFIFSVSGWQNMITILCALIILTMSYVPIYVIYARLSNNFNGTFKVKNYNIISFLSFYFSNLMLIWCGWNAVKNALIIFVVFFVFTLIKDIYKKTFQLNLVFHFIIPFHIVSIAICTFLKANYESIYFELISQFIISIAILFLIKTIVLKNHVSENRNIIGIKN